MAQKAQKFPAPGDPPPDFPTHIKYVSTAPFFRLDSPTLGLYQPRALRAVNAPPLLPGLVLYLPTFAHGAPMCRPGGPYDLGSPSHAVQAGGDRA